MKKALSGVFTSWLVRSRLIFLGLILCLLLIMCGTHDSTAAGGPVLISEAVSRRAIALDSVTWKSEPFPLAQPVLFGSDARTRIMLFATNLDLLPNENASAVTAEAEDGAGTRYPLTIEYVGSVSGFAWMSSVVVRLNDSLGDVGDVLVGISLHGTLSNRVRVAGDEIVRIRIHFDPIISG
jgi:hypothetical protein